MSDDVKVIAPEPSVEIRFTTDELRGLFAEIRGKGAMRGAWAKLMLAESRLNTLGVTL